jgi:hypothetical protein
MRASPRPKLLFFCDESSILGDPHMGVGAIAVRLERHTSITDQLKKIDEAFYVKSEVKWSTFKKRRMNVHEAYVDFLQSLVLTNMVHFHILFCPFYDFDHSESGPRKRVDSVSKMYYQLILHRALKYYGKYCDIYVRPDNGDCTDYLPSMVNVLNSTAR